MVLTLWAWGSLLDPFKIFRLGADYLSIHSSFSFQKKACCGEHSCPGEINLEKTGLEPWSQASPSVSVRERQKKYYGPMSQLYLLEIGEGIGTENQGQHFGS